MAKQSILIGTIANDGTGTNLREGGDIINDNFNEIYTAIGDGSIIDSSLFRNVIGGTGIGENLVGNDLTLSVDATVVTATSTTTLTNKTIDLADNTIEKAGSSVSTLAGTEVFTNKNLTAPTNTFQPISFADSSSTIAQVGLGETLGIIGGSGIETTITGDTVSIAITGITGTDLAANANILNTQLANDYVTIGYTNVALGSAATTVSGLSISGFAQFTANASASSIRFNHADFASFPSNVTYSGTPALDEDTGKPYFATATGYIEVLTESTSILPSGTPISSPVAGDTLSYNGTIWAQAQTPISQLLVTESGTGFLFTGAGFASTSGDNPDLHLKKGQTYYFINNAGGSHPFRIQSTSGSSGTVYNDGVTNNAGSTGAIILHVQMDAPATLYYQCTAHAALNGTISIT